MASYSGFRITLLAGDYPAKYDNFVTAAESVATEVETARAAYGSLHARIAGEVAALNASKVNTSGLTGDLSAGGYRITGAGNAVNSQDYVTLAQLTAASMSAALPAYAPYAGRNIRNTGATVFWASDSPSGQTATYNGNGQLTGLSETVDGYARTSAYTYNADGTVNTETVTWHGVTRVRTHNYTNGLWTGSTEV